MAKERHGEKWTAEEDKQLEKAFYEGCSFTEMANRLKRTWFACKCRLARLGLIEPFDRNNKDFFIGAIEPYRVPYSEIEFFNIHNIDIAKMEREIFNSYVDNKLVNEYVSSEEDTSNTFSNAELNIVSDWLKTRLINVVCKLTDENFCFIRGVELNTVKEIFENEIKLVTDMKKLSVKDREKILKRY